MIDRKIPCEKCDYPVVPVPESFDEWVERFSDRAENKTTDFDDPLTWRSHIVGFLSSSGAFWCYRCIVCACVRLEVAEWEPLMLEDDERASSS